MATRHRWVKGVESLVGTFYYCEVRCLETGKQMRVVQKNGSERVEVWCDGDWQRAPKRDYPWGMV